jgi:branched-chain amino acid aminotransferase
MEPGTHRAVPDPRNAEVLVYVNGEFLPRAEARISVFDSGYLVGDGVWEGIRLHRGRLLFLDRHLDRLLRNAAAIGLDPGLDRPGLSAVLVETARRNSMEDGAHLRLMLTRGNKVTPSQDPRLTGTGPNLVVIAEFKVPDPDLAERGITLFTSTVRRPGPDTLDPKLNCHSKLHEVIALLQAIEAGADEALMLDPTGAVATCNSTNFFAVVGGEVWTSPGLYCLDGITRGVVLELCAEHGIRHAERTFSPTDVYGATEAFVTGTFGGVTPVVGVDGRRIGGGVPGPVAARLGALYRDRIDREAGGG